MQLKDLTKPIDQMTDEEILDRIRTMRANRNTIRPAAKDHAKREAKKGTAGKSKQLDLLVKDLTPEQIQALLYQLGG